MRLTRHPEPGLRGRLVALPRLLERPSKARKVVAEDLLGRCGGVSTGRLIASIDL